MLDAENTKWLEKGLRALAKLTTGKVFLGVKAGSSISSQAATVYEFEGPHPAGNVGTQIAAIKPVNKGETVWTLDAVTAAKIGKLCEEGKLDSLCFRGSDRSVGKESAYRAPLSPEPPCQACLTVSSSRIPTYASFQAMCSPA